MAICSVCVNREGRRRRGRRRRRGGYIDIWVLIFLFAYVYTLLLISACISYISIYIIYLSIHPFFPSTYQPTYISLLSSPPPQKAEVIVSRASQLALAEWRRRPAHPDSFSSNSLQCVDLSVYGPLSGIRRVECEK